MIEHIREHFRARGGSPSHAEIADGTGLRPQHVGRFLDELQAAGLLTFRRGIARSIVLTDRMANYSDAEIRLACIARGMTVTETSMPQLAATFSVGQDVTDLGLPLIEALQHIE